MTSTEDGLILYLIYHKLVAIKIPFTRGLKSVEWLEDNQRESAKAVRCAWGIVALLEIIKVFPPRSKQPPIHSWLKGLVCGKNH